MPTSGRWGLPWALLLGVLAAAGLLWVLTQEEDAGSALEDPAGEPGTAASTGGDASPPEAINQRALVRSGQGADRGLPRVLPPDAAVEDVRDALALPREERGDSLERARDAMLRLAGEGEKVVRGLRTYADAVEDEVVRAVVLASLGTYRTDSHRHWLCEQVERAPTGAERIGALIALAHPTDVRLSKRKGGPGSAEAKPLGGLAYRYDAVPPSPAALQAVSHWLRRGKAEEARAGLPIVLRCVREYSAWATLLVGDSGRMRPWISLLSTQGRARVKSTALAHADLSAEVRAAITSAR